jgi:hypothetical protein
MSTKTTEKDTHIKVYDALPPMRSGGETRPLDFPHLYQIQAGDWRISYAVEHNRLAILVLEVLGAEGAAPKDPVQEQITRKMKVKLLDWPEGSPSKDLPPEELGKKVKIKLLDLADDMKAETLGSPRRAGRIKFEGSSRKSASHAGKITLLDQPATRAQDETVDAQAQTDDEEEDRKVTPLNSPTV